MHLPWRTFLISALATTVALAALGASSALAAPKEIAYGCKKLDICLLDPDNPSAVTNLTDNEGTSIDEKPVWAPDGKRVAFISRFASEPIQTRNIYVMEPEAPGEGINLAVQVTHFTNGEFIGEPVWSPDGTRIAFVTGTSEGNRSVGWRTRTAPRPPPSSSPHTASTRVGHRTAARSPTPKGHRSS